MSENLQGWKRTDYCTNFTKDDVGKEVTLMGWVQTRRDLGALIFVDLRDRTGLMQAVFDESLLETPFAWEKGWIKPSKQPGLGTELNEAALRKHGIG